MYNDSEDEIFEEDSNTPSEHGSEFEGDHAPRKEEIIYRSLFYSPEGPYQASLGEIFPCVREEVEPVNLVGIVPALKCYPAVKEKVDNPQDTTPQVVDQSTPVTPPEPTSQPSTNPILLSNFNFTSTETPANMKESPASKSMRNTEKGPGIVFPIDFAVNRSTLQKALCGGPEADEECTGCPWNSKIPETLFTTATLKTIRALNIERDSIHVGYIETVPAEVALIAVEKGALRDSLLSLIPGSRVPFDWATSTPDDIMKAMLPFLKPKSRSSTNADKTADVETNIGGGAAMMTVTEKLQQQEVAAQRRANDALRKKQVDPYALATYLLGRPVAEPTEGGQALLHDDAIAVAAALRSSSQCRWFCIDFEAACVGKFESAIPLEVAVVEASVSGIQGGKAGIGALTKASCAEPMGTGPAVDTLVKSVVDATSYFTMIHPGQLNDINTAARLSVMACNGGQKSSMSGHGIPFDGLELLRKDYIAIAEELVNATGLGPIVHLNKELQAPKTRAVLIGKGPTLVEMSSLRWCLAAANTCNETPIYDLSLEKAMAIPLFDISAVAGLVSIVCLAVKQEVADAAFQQPLKMPSDSVSKMLCSCSYHWEFYSSGAAYAIASQARTMLNGLLDDFLIDVDDCDEEAALDGPLDIDIHCARSDAYFLKLQVEELVGRLDL